MALEIFVASLIWHQWCFVVKYYALMGLPSFQDRAALDRTYQLYVEGQRFLEFDSAGSSVALDIAKLNANAAKLVRRMFSEGARCCAGRKMKSMSV